MASKKENKQEDAAELNRRLEEIQAKQTSTAMINAANKIEIQRINFNKLINKQKQEPKKRQNENELSVSLDMRFFQTNFSTKIAKLSYTVFRLFFPMK